MPLEGTRVLERDAVHAAKHRKESCGRDTGAPASGQAWRMAELVYLRLVLTNCELTVLRDSSILIQLAKNKLQAHMQRDHQHPWKPTAPSEGKSRCLPRPIHWCSQEETAATFTRTDSV